VKNQKRSADEDGLIYNYHLPSNLLLHYLVKSKWSLI